MKQNEEKYLRNVYVNNFEIGSGDKEINEETYEVDKAYDSRGIVFLSEWFFDQKINEYSHVDEKTFSIGDDIPNQYCFPDSFQMLNKKIEDFHKSEGFYGRDSEVFITEGSTPMIASMVIFAKKLGFTKIHSVSPLYFNIFKVAELIDIPIEPINRSLTYSNSEINLPLEKSILFITDPIWSIGRNHSVDVIKKIRDWQENTESIVFVDGSFSYTNWYSKDKWEQTSMLNPELTFRLVCPTKTLGLNGLRFSYLLCPSKFKKELSRITCCTIGSSSHYSHKLRPFMFEMMIKKEINPVGRFSRDRFEEIKPLLESQGIDYIEPNCGFFMFIDLRDFLKKKKLISQYMWIPNAGLDIFDSNYEGYAKVNLIMRQKSFDKFKKDLE